MSCAPESGLIYAIGTTAVTCSAIDPAANSGTCTFSVTARGAAEQLQTLADEIAALGLPGGIEASLLAQIEAAIASLGKGGTPATCGELRALRSEILALRGKVIRPSDADALLARIDQVLAVLGC